MKTLMDICRRLFKRRRHKRSTAEGGIFVSVSFPFDEYREIKVELVDISVGGARFIYQGYFELEKSGFLRLSSSTSDSERLKFDTVTDIPDPGGKKTSKPYRLRAVRFREISSWQKKDLEAFIWRVGVIS